MQTQDNTPMCYRRGNQSTRPKTFLRPSKQQIDPLENKLEYTNNKRPSKPTLSHVLKPSKLLLPTDFTKPCFFQLFRSHNFADCTTKQMASSNASQQHQNLTLHSEQVRQVFGLSTSQGFGNGEVGVEENHNVLCIEL